MSGGNGRNNDGHAESSPFSRVPADIMAIITLRLLPSPAALLNLPVAANPREADRCWRDYRYCLLHQAWSQVAVSDIDPGNDRGRALLHAMITRVFAAAHDLQSGDLLNEF